MNARGLEIRGARASDDDALRKLDRATWSPWATPSPPPPDEWTFFGERTSPDDVLVATVAGDVVGYANVQPPTPLPSNAHVLAVTGLAVAPAVQGRGVGRTLVEAAIRHAAARGARRLTLRVLAPIERARVLYACCGFEVEGVLRGEFLLEGSFVDDVLMARALSSSP